MRIGKADYAIWETSLGRLEGSVAAARGLKCSANLGHLVGTQLSDGLHQECLRNGSQVVEADRALARHAVPCVQLNLGLDAANRDDDVSELWNRLVAGEHADRTPSLLRQLQPADLASGYHRSSGIASRAFAIAQLPSRSLAEVASSSRYEASSS